MTTHPCKITIHMVASLDGFIARNDNDTSWFETSDHYAKGVELTKQQTEDFLKSIDCYVMGANTYEHAWELSKQYGWPYGDTPTIVITHRKLPVERANVELYAGDIGKLVSERLQPNYQHVWIAGGAKLVKDFIRLKLADEIRLSVMPIILGEGVSLFDSSLQQQSLHLKDVTAYKSGMVELWYEIKKDGAV